jgi:hypothetical protein
MKLKKLSDIFDVQYGHSLELNRLKKVGPEGIPFVSRQMGNNGISAYVERIPDLDPAPAGELTCALSGNGVLSTFVQERPFYTAFHVARLLPRVKLDVEQKLYYCTCIKSNRYRYSYGRQANRSLREILLPSPRAIKEVVSAASIENELRAKLKAVAHLSRRRPPGARESLGRACVRVADIFVVQYGHSLELNRLKITSDGVNFVSRTARNNGISARVSPVPGLLPAPAGLITVAGGGSVLETFVQLEPFYCGRDMYWLIAKRAFSVEQKLFYCACLRANKFRYNFGRQANKTLRGLKVPAPESIPAAVFGELGRIAREWQGKIRCGKN